MDACNNALVGSYTVVVLFFERGRVCGRECGSDDDDLMHILIVNVLADGCNNGCRWKWETVQM